MAIRLPEQSARVGAVLREVVADHGPEVLSRPELLSNLLADLLPDAPRVARLLVAAAEDQIGDLLLGHVAHGMDVSRG